jgi:hypothetical protein
MLSTNQSLEIDKPKELVGIEDILVSESAVKPEKDGKRVNKTVVRIRLI